jgi:hypothetical protein|tara:strand:+ start:260 stop:472 length:213 start_codon:yes stop_codon:yes gene_type:complete
MVLKNRRFCIFLWKGYGYSNSTKMLNLHIDFFIKDNGFSDKQIKDIKLLKYEEVLHIERKKYAVSILRTK